MHKIKDKYGKYSISSVLSYPTLFTLINFYKILDNFYETEKIPKNEWKMRTIKDKFILETKKKEGAWTSGCSWGVNQIREGERRTAKEDKDSKNAG